MTPERSAFLSAVLRFLSLQHGPDRALSGEYKALRSELTDAPVGSLRPSWEQRGYWRMPMERLGARFRFRNYALDIGVLDVSGTGMRVEDPGLRAIEQGSKAVVSLRIPRSTLQVELPVEVMHRDAAERCLGLRFRGAPVLLQRRPTCRRVQPGPMPTGIDQAFASGFAWEQGTPGHALSAAPVVSDPAAKPANDVEPLAA